LLRVRRAHVERVERGKLLDIALHQIGEAQQQTLPLGRLELAPRPIEGSPCRSDRAIDVLGITFGYVRQKFARSRIASLEGLARCGLQPLAIDQHALRFAVQVRMHLCHYVHQFDLLVLVWLMPGAASNAVPSESAS
jgi:hypothetical protein